MVLPTIAEHARSHGIIALKKLGQNFIFDSSLCHKIVRHCPNFENQLVIEIGPGPAGLTRSILEKNPKNLIVIELDDRCISLLEEIKLQYNNLIIIKGDALKLSLDEIINQAGVSLAKDEKIGIISNLPYNIATELISRWLKQINLISFINVMVQKEVAERYSATPGNKTYGRLSVVAQLTCKVTKLFDVSPESFYPKPKIWSAILQFLPNEKLLTLNQITQLEDITRIAFSQRRKMLKSSLKNYIAFNKKLANFIADIAELRAENLSPEVYLQLINLIE